MKETKEHKIKKASFFKRLGAYILDTIIISLIVSIISAGFSSKKYEESSEKYNNLTMQYVQQEITDKEYKDQIGPIFYEVQKSGVAVSAIMVISSIAYFIVFQYLNKGQTIGKKLLGIRVQEKGKNPSLKSIIIRTILVDSILSLTLGIILLYILNKNKYYITYNIISTVELIFIFITALFILYRKDKKGVHDFVANTEVIDERGI